MEDVLVLQNETKEVNLTIMKHVILEVTKALMKAGLIGIVCYNIYLANNEFNKTRLLPMKIESTENKDIKRTKEALAILNLPANKIPTYSESVILASRAADVDPVLIVALMYTESSFKVTARSSKGYTGLMQTPSRTGYVEADIMHGASILKEKLQISKGDIHKALTFYKGSKYDKNNLGYKQATQVLDLYNKLNKRIVV